MADFTPKADAGKAKGGLAKDNAEHMEPPTIHLGHEHLAKLGMKEMPKVGSKIKISGLAHVGSTSENQDRGDGGKPRRSMTLHLHKMDVGADGTSDEEKSASQHDGMKGAIDNALGAKRSEGSESAKAKSAGGKEKSKASGG